ncbi:MAG: hypothetical protein H7Y31_06010 [Chitinophagaceae bacterium]|nr:hypothetical protein [Chitinophagaceae bacterium]
MISKGKVSILMLATCVCSILSFAQKLSPSCGMPPVALDAASKARRAAAEKILQSRLLLNSAQDNDDVYTLPIVVHVIHTGTAIGSPDNPTDAQINAMIAELNNNWRRNPGPYGGVDMKIQFALASRSPFCGATTGINRVNGSAITNYSSGGIAIHSFNGSAEENAVKNLSRWSNTDYINVWIVNKINGSSTAVGGFAYFAQYAQVERDGIVINSAFVNGGNKILAHEMGHVFELYHTFYDDNNETTCPSLSDCVNAGDRVCDTEPAAVAYNCAGTVNSCTGNTYLIADPVKNYSVLHNYMNYTDCSVMFTAGQKDRVRAALFAFRNGLTTSGGLSPAPSSSPIGTCIPAANNGLSIFYGIERVEFGSLSVYSNSSSGEGANYIDRTCNQRTVLLKGQTYQLTITGSYENPHFFKALLDYNNDGDFDDANEMLVSGNPNSGIISVPVTIPANALTGVAMRLRIIADNPDGGPQVAGACQLVGTASDGAGQVEDFTVILTNSGIQSVTGGPWNNPSTWSCNCIPSIIDNVTIKTGHAVTITQAMGTIECTTLTVESGASISIGPNAIFRQRR